MAVFHGCGIRFRVCLGIDKVFYEEDVKEYTLLAIGSGLIIIVLDVFILRTRILATKIFWIFLCIMFGFKTVVNGYLTWRPIVVYGEQFNVGIRLFTIPIEDYVYGFSLITLSVMLWEYLKNAKHRSLSKKMSEYT